MGVFSFSRRWLRADYRAPLGRLTESPCAYQMRSLVSRMARDTVVTSRIWRALKSARSPWDFLRGRFGFTLVEVAVAGAIAAVLLLAIAAAFHASSMAWGRGVGMAERALRVEAVLERWSEELQQAVPMGMAGGGFVGRGDAMAWWVTADNGMLPVRIDYRYDSGSRSVVRREVALSETTASDRGDGRTVLTDVTLCVLAFPYRSDGAVVWRDEWGWADRVPASVRVVLSVAGERSGRSGANEPFTIERIVPIPHGVLGEE